MSDEAKATEHDEEHVDDHEEEGELVPEDAEPETLDFTEDRSGNDLIEVLLFEIVVSPESSVSAFYQVVVKEPRASISDFSVSFVRTKDNVVVDTVAGSTVNSPGQGVSGALDVLPGAFTIHEGNGASCIISGFAGGKNFFFRKPVELE